MTDDPTVAPKPGPGDDADELDLVFVRYFSGQLSQPERRRLDRWLAEAPGRADELERLRELWQRTEAEPLDVDPVQALARFKARARREDAKTAVRAFGLRRRHAPWLAAAAAVVLAVGLGIWSRHVTSAGPAPAVATASHTFKTPRGQRAQLDLPDGTHVLLGPSSSLDVPLGFGTGTRDVHLVGLAFFEVAKDSARPFRVRGGGGTARVLGTKFSARADSGATGPLDVVVSEGHVALGRPDAEGNASHASAEVLARGDYGHLAADGTVQVLHGVDLTRRLGWIDGRLDFTEAPLPVVLHELESWFDVDFVLADPALRDAHLTTTLRGDSFVETLRLLEAALGIKAEVEGKTVTLRLVRRPR